MFLGTASERQVTKLNWESIILGMFSNKKAQDAFHLGVFESVLVVAFQNIFCSEIYQNNKKHKKKTNNFKQQKIIKI